VYGKGTCGTKGMSPFLGNFIQRNIAIMKDAVKIRLTYESPLLNLPTFPKAELKKIVTDSLKINKVRNYKVEVLNEKDEVVLKFKFAG